MLPEWSKTTHVLFIKLLIINLTTIAWYERSCVQPGWKEFCLSADFNDEEKRSNVEAKNTVVRAAITRPFTGWCKNKIIVSSIMHASLSGVVMLWGAINTYLTIKPMLEEQS
jgi:hypothetical protein